MSMKTTLKGTTAGQGLRRLATMRCFPFLKHDDIISNQWTGPDLTIAVIADLHVVSPWVTLRHVRDIADAVNDLGADVIMLAGDFLAGRNLPGKSASMAEIADALAALDAPFGVFAVLGNHDWYDCDLATRTQHAENSVVNALRDSKFHFLQNENLVINHPDGRFWVAGMDSQRPNPRDRTTGYHNPDLAFAGIPDAANAILLAHEPDYFAQGDRRPALQISGHTHGGQLNLFGWRPMTPSIYRGRYAYGHHVDGDRQMIVSAGVGFSGLPLRIGQVPEVNLIRLRSAE